MGCNYKNSDKNYNDNDDEEDNKANDNDNYYHNDSNKPVINYIFIVNLA